MTVTQITANRTLQRQLSRRQALSEASIAALAHGAPAAARLDIELSDVETRLEQGHPRIVSRLAPSWAVADADLLASHQFKVAAGCTACQAASQQHDDDIPGAADASRQRTA
jgi:hypothetical protein